MSAVLRASLAVGGYRARVVVRDHHDEAWAEDHQEGQQIARPFGFHYAPAHRHHVGFHASGGKTQCLVGHRLPSFPCRSRGHAPARAFRYRARCQSRNAIYRGELSGQLVLRERKTAASTPAFTTEFSVWKKRGRGDRGDYRIT